MKWLVAIIGFGYLLMPIDLIPDVIPVLGVIDDAGVIGYLGYLFFQPKVTKSPR